MLEKYETWVKAEVLQKGGSIELAGSYIWLGYGFFWGFMGVFALFCVGLIHYKNISKANAWVWILIFAPFVIALKYFVEGVSLYLEMVKFPNLDDLEDEED